MFFSHKMGLSIWRAVPPPGYVALGDVVLKTTSATASPPPTDVCYCVPDWAARESALGGKIYGAKKGGGESKNFNISLWASRSGLGLFFGSPHELRRSPTGAVDQVDGVPETIFALKSRGVHAALTGEWADEIDVLTRPSLSWSIGLLNFLLDNNSTRGRALSATMFCAVVTYIRSAAAAAPLQAVPLLIRMIRMAQETALELPMHLIEGLCKAILLKAVSKSQAGPGDRSDREQRERDKAMPLSDALVGLVDLVVETHTVAMQVGGGGGGGFPPPPPPLLSFTHTHITTASQIVSI